MVGESIQSLDKNLLGEKWAFNSDKTVQGIRVGDCFKIASSVATLLNEAFIVKNGIIEDEYYKIDHFKIEMKLLKKAASPKNKKYKKFEEYIIFRIFTMRMENCNTILRRKFIINSLVQWNT